MTNHPSRWTQLQKTSPSGKSVFICQCCGIETSAPTAICPAMYKAQIGGKTYMAPCHSWPQKPEEYVRQQKIIHGEGAYFSGTVTMDDGTHIEVSAPIPDELGRQIAALSVVYDLKDKRQESARASVGSLGDNIALTGGVVLHTWPLR